MSSRPWWTLLAALVVAWIVVAGVRVSAYSEVEDVPGLLTAALWALPVLAVVALALAITTAARGRAGQGS